MEVKCSNPLLENVTNKDSDAYVVSDQMSVFIIPDNLLLPGTQQEKLRKSTKCQVNIKPMINGPMLN